MNTTSRAAALCVIALLGVAVLGVLTWVIVWEPSYRPWIKADHLPTAFTDLLSRLLQVNNARAGYNIYLPLNPNGFLYPPAAILLFLPLTYLPTLDAFAIWTGLSLFCLSATYLVVLRATRSGTWLEHITISVWACVVTAILFPPVITLLNMGQVSTILVLLVTLDLLAVRDRSQGVLVGAATAFKIYPGVVILFWLVRRQWRPAITALVSFGLFTAVSWLAWPTNSAWYFSGKLFGGQEMNIIEIPGLVLRNSSLLAAFLRIGALPQSAAVVLGAIAGVTVVIVGVLLAKRVYRNGFPVCALVTLLCTSVLISPVAWDDYFTFMPLLVFVIMEVGLRSAAGKVAAVALAIFTFPWFAFRLGTLHPSLHQNIVQDTSRNAVFVAALLVLLTGALAARRAGAGDQSGETVDSLGTDPGSGVPRFPKPFAAP